MSNPASAPRNAACRYASVTASMSARVMARGTWFAGDQGTAEAAMTGQFPSSRGSFAPSHSTLVEALGPACPSWSAIFAVVRVCT